MGRGKHESLLRGFEPGTCRFQVYSLTITGIISLVIARGVKLKLPHEGVRTGGSSLQADIEPSNGPMLYGKLGIQLRGMTCFIAHKEHAQRLNTERLFMQQDKLR